MKKLLLSILLFLLTFNMIACSNQKTNPIDKKLYHDFESIENIDSIESMIKYSTNIVKAKLLSIEKFDEFYWVYKYEVIYDYTNNTNEIINVYDNYNESYSVDSLYLMFLEQVENALYPHTIYTSSYKEFFAELSANPLFRFNGSDLNISEEDIDKIIKKNVSDGNLASKVSQANIEWEILITDNLETTLQSADLITKIKILEERSVNKYASSYEVETLDILKGTEKCSSFIYLQPGLDKENEYYILQKKDPSETDSYVIFSRNYIAIDVTSNTGEYILTKLDRTANNE